MKHSSLAAWCDAPPTVEQSFRGDVLAGLKLRPRSVPCKYFYDEAGSRLFDAICNQPEYYPTRAELQVMRAHADEMAGLVGPRAMLVELGSGSSAKTRMLLDRLPEAAAYVPIDISGEYLARTALGLRAQYPQIEVRPLCADFTGPLELPPPAQRARRKVAYFPGSTIGNFEPTQATALLSRIRRMVGPGGGLLIGVDLKKDTATLERAYNDASGVTAAFNLNLLLRMNRELAADFDPDSFAHLAFYNFQLDRVEMHLLSLRDQLVSVAGHRLSFRRAETIHTENSYKYGDGEFELLAMRAGFTPRRDWTDADGLFKVHYLTV